MKNKKIITKNKKVYFDYTIDEEIEAGIVLLGSELKSIRQGFFNIKESFILVNPKTNQTILHNAHIKQYFEATINNHNPTRNRVLLLKKKEIKKLIGKSKIAGYTIKPIEAYFKEHLVKIKIGICKGKKKYDKRETIKKREAKIQMDKVKKHINQ